MFRSVTQKSNPILLPPLLLTVGLLLFGFGVLVIGIDAMHMRPDEQLTYQNMRFDFFESMTVLITRNNQAPLWWIQIWAWQRTAGMTEFAGRVNSILWSMITLSLLYQMGKTWFRDKRFGWFAIAILSVNSYFFIYALEIRMYVLGMTTAVLSMWLFSGWLRKRTISSAMMYGLSTAVMLYTHYYLGFIVIVQVLYFVIFHLLNWTLIRQMVIAGTTALLAWLVGLIVLINQLQWIAFAESGGLTVPTKPTNSDTILELAQLASNGYWWLYGIIVLIGLILLWRKRWYWLMLVWLIGFPALVFILNTQATVYNIRYTSFLIPAIGLTIGAAIGAIPFDKKFAWSNWSLVIFLCGVSLYNLQNYIPERIPFRTILGDISQTYQVDDVWYALPIEAYNFYDDQYDRYLPDSLIDNRVFSAEDAISNRRIWFTTDRFLQDDVQAEFRLLEATHRVWYVAESSECSNEYCYIAQLMVAPPMDEAVYFGETLGFLGADISPIEDNQLEVILWWEVEQSPTEDYSISLQLLRDDGSLVTQVDRQIDPPSDDIGEIPTSAMIPDDNYIDLRVLDLPPDVANGDYTLQVVVYQWWDGIRLMLPDDRDAFEIETIPLNR
ncbi:MAG: glycosyltransferase family 39 protein [Chloroflexota bacterium]